MAIDKITTAAITDGTIVTAEIANANVTAEKLASGTVQNQSAFRNIMQNGNMSLAQRGTSTTGIGTSNGYFSCDRFKTGTAGSNTFRFTQSQSTDVPTGQGFANSLKMDCTTADTSLASGDRIEISPRFEGQDLQYLKKGTSSAESTTLSFWVKSNKTGTYICELYDTDNTRQISKSYTISSSNTWEKKELTFAGDTTGTLTNDNGHSIQLSWFLAAGSDMSSGTLSTSWGSVTGANRAVGQVNLGDNTSNEWYITGVQFEAGTTASDFEFLPVDVNLGRCQRYYQKTFEYSQVPVDNSQKFEYHFIEPYSGSSISGIISYFSVEMRVQPTVTIYTSGQSANGTGKMSFYGGSWGNATASVQGGSTTKCVHFDSAYSNAKLVQFNYEASAEL